MVFRDEVLIRTNVCGLAVAKLGPSITLSSVRMMTLLSPIMQNVALAPRGSLARKGPGDSREEFDEQSTYQFYTTAMRGNAG